MAGDLTDHPYEALVVGGGVNGLARLYHLLRLGCRRAALIERRHAAADLA